MKAARYHSYEEHDLRLDEVPEPIIGAPHDVIVRIGGAGLCRTDLHVIEGIWRDVLNPKLPFVLGHENAGWVEAVGSAVTSVAPGDAVILHPLLTCGVCSACRAGEDMYCSTGTFPGLDADGGFARYLRSTERSCLKLARGLEPRQVAPFADAGLTAYRAAKKAALKLPPGSRAVVIGTGGLGHIGLQCLKALTAAEIIAVDVSESARELAKSVGADQVLPGGPDAVAALKEMTGGRGAEVVLDFVGEHGTTEQGPAMLAKGGTYYVIGYGARVDVPAIQIIFQEIGIVGSLVGNYGELAELMALVAQGGVRLRTQEYPLDEINQAMEDLAAGRILGRGVLVPAA